MRLSVAAAFSALLVACLNDYSAFDFSGEGEADASPGSGGAPADASGGTAGVDASSGASGTGACTPGQLSCDGTCASRASPRHCGSCDNDCTVLGFGAGFVCLNGACGCGIDGRCGAPPAICQRADGPCICGGDVCRAGESCVGEDGPQSCGCKGGPACADGEKCGSNGCE